MANSPSSSSSSSSSDLFFSESANSVDILLEEQDVIIDDLRKEIKQLNIDLDSLKAIIRLHLVGCLKTINALFEKVL